MSTPVPRRAACRRGRPLSGVLRGLSKAWVLGVAALAVAPLAHPAAGGDFVPSAGARGADTISNIPFTASADYSANAAAIPIAGYVLLLTIPANGTRNSVEVQNQSTDTVQLVRDDGAGDGQTSLMLAPAAAVGGQGGGWSSTTFLGRLRVYAPSSGDRVAAYQE